MQIHVHLHGILREVLPPSAKGRTTLDFQNPTTIKHLLSQLGITRRVEVAINDNLISNLESQLQDGDQVAIFTIIGGG